MMFGSKNEFIIKRLSSGGVITNYCCTSACGHCLYGCSPYWPKDYVDQDTVLRIFNKVRELGCHSVHIGGGEPFLNQNGLERVLETAAAAGVGVDYVETNSSWYTNREAAEERLIRIKQRGIHTLLISISPFHNTHVPFNRVKRVIALCNETGLQVFPWISDFFHEIDAFDDQITHELSEYTEKYGDQYLKSIPSRYWVQFGGRALQTFFPVLPTRPVTRILSDTRNGCGELLNVSHFHLDLYGRYIPGFCSGLAIRMEDLGRAISPDTYPILCRLFFEGINALFDMAVSEYDYQPRDAYLNKCHLCFDIRKYLVMDRGLVTNEFHPKGFYAFV